MSGDEAMKLQMEQLQKDFETHRGDMVRYMQAQTSLLKEVVSIQAKQQEAEKNDNKLFEIYSKLSDRVRDLEISGAGGAAKIAGNERLVWLFLSLFLTAGAGGMGVAFGGG